MKESVEDSKLCSWRRVWQVVSFALVGVVVVGAIALVALRIAGFQMFTVLSGSMEPNYPVGSLIYVKPVDVATLKEGDVVSFATSETTVVTHRINKVITEMGANGEEVLKFQTKGDANNVADGKLVHYKNVVGAPVVVIPFLGYASMWMQQPPGMYVVIAVCALLIGTVIVPSVVKMKGKEGATQESRV